MVAAFIPRPFVPLPVHLVRDTTLSDGALRLFGVLLDHAGRRGYCWPGQCRLAAILGRSEVTIRRWLKELVAAGLVVKQRRGLTMTNVYRIVSPRDTLSHKQKAVAPERNSVIIQEQSAVIDKPEQEESEQKGDLDISIAPHPKSAAGSKKPTRCRVPPPYDPTRAKIAPLILDLRRDLHDRAPATATVTRAVNLYKRAEVDLDRFAAAVYEARAITQERSSSIRSVAPENQGKAKAGYFMAVLADRLGLRAASEERPPTEVGAESPATASPTSTPIAPPMDAPPPTREWPPALIDLGIPDLPTYIRICRRGLFSTVEASVEYARRHGRGCVDEHRSR